MKQPTPIPWERRTDIEARGIIIDADGGFVADFEREDAADLAVARVNNFGPLVELVIEAMGFATRQTGNASCCKSAYKLSEKCRVLLKTLEE